MREGLKNTCLSTDYADWFEDLCNLWMKNFNLGYAARAVVVTTAGLAGTGVLVRNDNAERISRQ